MSEPQKKKRIEIPKDLGKQEREALASDVIDFIKARTEKGVDAEGKKFAPYSESYVHSQDFKNAGKSKNHVNLRLSDEMMDSLELVDQGPGFITIGYEEGTFANDKAVWAERADNGPSRHFVGIAEKDLEKLIAKVTVETTAINNTAESVTKSLLKRFGL